MRPCVLVHISKSWIRVTTLGRAEARSRTIGFDREQAGAAWSAGLKPLDDALRHVVDHLECAGAEAVVLYENPTCVVDVHHAPVTGQDAIRAARLALRDAAPTQREDDPTAFLILDRDCKGDARRTHVLGVYDDATNAQAAIDFVQRAGLRCRAIAPAAATLAAASIADALEVSHPQVVVFLRLEEDGSTLTATQSGRILLFRMIDIGVDRLVEAMTRPIVRQHEEITLTDDEAKGILDEFGVPAYGDTIDASRGLTGADLLPIIQPVLQRLVVEVKQSLRFSLNEEQRSGLSIQIRGVGASIKRLPEILSQETEAPVVAVEASANHTESPQDDPATRAAVAERLSLLPPAAMRSRLSRGVQRGLIAGGVIAFALLAVDAAWSVWVTRSMDQHIASLEAVADRIGATREALATAEQDVATARHSAAQITQTMPPRAHWGAWLAELSRLTPTAVRLTQVNGAHETDGAHVRLHGVAEGESSEASRQAIAHFVDSIRACPLVARVELGGIRRGEDGAGARQEFEASVSLAAVPVTPPQPEAQP